MASNNSSNQIHNHYSCSSRSSRASSREKIVGPKYFCRIQTRVKYSSSGKNPGRAYYNCPNFPNGCDFFCWVENYGPDEDKDAKIRDLLDEISMQYMLKSIDVDGAYNCGYRRGGQVYGVAGLIGGVLLSLLLFLAFFKQY